MESEVLEVEMELENGEKVQMKIQQSDDWTEIEEGTKALMLLIDGQQMLVEIIEACEYEGVSFKIIGFDREYFHEAEVVDSIFCEVK